MRCFDLIPRWDLSFAFSVPPSLGLFIVKDLSNISLFRCLHYATLPFLSRLSAMSAESASSVRKGQVDLSDFIDWSGVECLNQSSTCPLSNALKQGHRDDDALHLESDADEQLLVYIPFTQVVKLYSVVIKGPEEEGPKTVKLFANKEHMGFSDVNDFPPSDVAVLSPDNLKGKPTLLKYVKFQSVRSLTIFIEDNQTDSEITKVEKIVFYGTIVETTDMKGLKKIEDH